MVAVLVTAVATWLMILLMDVVNLGGFLLEGTVAVLGGAAVGLLIPWLLVRRRRNAT
jgi:hypothetical protein